MKLSIVIPCYNAARTLERAVASVASQNLAECEILLVDDGSTDGTVALAETLAAAEPRLRLIRLPENGGPAAARNAGLAAAEGEYVGFLDADDAYGENVFASVLRDLEAFAWADGIEFGVRLVDSHREVHPAQLAMIGNSIPTNLIVRRRFVQAVGGFPIEPEFRTAAGGEDIAYRLALRRWGTIGAAPHVFLDYTVHRGSYFDRFMDRTRVIDGEVQFLDHDAHAQTLDAALQKVLARIDAAMLRGAGNPPLHRIACDFAGRRFDFETVDRPERIGQAAAFLTQREYPLLPILGPVRTVLDVGAEVGASAVYFACTYPSARVVALEPTRQGFVLLRRNSLPHANLETYHCGLYNVTNRMEVVHAAAGGGGEAREEVLMVEAARFFESLRLEEVDIVRMDNRGVEVQALIAMRDRLRAAKAVFVTYRRETDRRLIDELMAPTHLLYWGRNLRANYGEFVYVQKTLAGPEAA